MSDNPYSTPASTHILQKLPPGDKPELATVGERFLGALIDSIVLGIPIFYITHKIEGGSIPIPVDIPPFAWDAVFSLIYFLIFAAINITFLSSTGQTIGKKIVRTQIVDVHSCEIPPLFRLLFHRTGVFYIIGLIPVVGTLLVLLENLAVFRTDRRCLHDMVAGTIVVKYGHDSQPNLESQFLEKNDSCGK